MSGVQQGTLWLLSDGLPGHVNQARSVARLLSREYHLEVVEVKADIRHKWLRPLLALWLNCGGLISPRLIQAFYRVALPIHAPDLIISAGGNTSFLNAMLGRLRGCPNLFIGSLRRLHAGLFTVVLTLEPIGAANNIVIDVPPSLIDPDELAAEAAEFHRRRTGTEPVFAMIIGGDGAGYAYTDRDWCDLASAMISISQVTGCRWLLTTSRRTGEAAERVLREQLPSVLLEDAVWYAESPQPVMRLFLAAAQRVFVTADSMSMLADAIASERPVVALYPRHAQPNQRYRNALQKFHDQGFLEALPFADASCFHEVTDANKQSGHVGEALLRRILPHLTLTE